MASTLARPPIEVPCRIDIAHTSRQCHAHVEVMGFSVGPGDSVQILDAPVGITYGHEQSYDRNCRISRASWWTRMWTRLTARFELSVLYEVSFSPGRLHAVAGRHPRVVAQMTGLKRN